MPVNEQRNCEQCKYLSRHPMYMIAPVPSYKSAIKGRDDDRVLITAQIKCSCSDDMEIDSDINAADLSNLKPEIRYLIYNRISSYSNYIPIIDPERINHCDCVMFVTGFSKNMFKSWMALDLLTVEQFNEHIERKDIIVEEIRI